MKAINFLFAAAGAGIGSAVTYFVLKKKLDEKDKEIIDIRSSFRSRVKEIENERATIDSAAKKKAEMIADLEKKTEDKLPDQYVDYSSITKKAPVKSDNPIRFIAESEAQKYSKDFELIGLSLYSDNVLIDDETDNIIEEYEYWIGKDGIDTIRNMDKGEPIYILNEYRKTVYDVTVLDERFGDDYEPVTIE